MTQSDEPRIKIEGTGNVIGDHNTVIVYKGDRPVSVADVLGACRSQVRGMVTEARHKYDPALYVHRAIEQELNRFFDTPLDAGAANCYLIVAPAGSGKTNLLCHLAGERAGVQPVMLLMGGNLYLSPTSGLFGALQSELQTANQNVNFRSAEDCLHALYRVAEETGRDALIILDAINEYDKPIEMRKAVEDLLRKTRGRRVKLVVTCRDFYWGVFKGSFWEGATINPLPADISEDEEGAPGSGDFNRFTVDEQEIALGLYLAHYGISGRPIGDAVEQLRHPLLLRFFCEAYRGQEVEELEDIRLKELFDRYWDQKLASVAERMIKGGDERVQEALQEELGDYLLSVAAYMLRRNVRAIPEGDMPKATGLTEKHGDPRTVYGRIRDEFIILEERERGQGRRKAVQVAFVYEEFMEYTMARSLLRDWEDLDERGILAAIDAPVAQYASFAQVLGVMVYVGLMLRQQRGLALWSTLMSRGGPWRDVVLDAIRKLPESQVDSNVFAVLDEALALQDVELTTRALDILKTRRFGQRAPEALMEKVCDLSCHREESIRRRVMLAIGNAPTDLRRSVLEQGLRDSVRGVRENALASVLALPTELALHLLLLALADYDGRTQSIATEGLVRIGSVSVEPVMAVLRNGNASARREAVATLELLGDARAVEPLVAALGDNDSNVRGGAAYALAHLCWQPKSQSERGWYLAAQQEWALCARLGIAGVEPLAVALQSGIGIELKEVATALAEIGPAALKPLVAALRDGRKDVRQRAAEALGQLGDVRAVEPLVALLQDSDGAVRQAAADALGQLKDVRAVEPLVGALRDGNKDVRRQAAKALSQFRWDSRADANRGWRAMALQDWVGCVRLGISAVEPLMAALRDRDAVVRQAAADTLGKIGSSAVEPLMAALRDSEAAVQQAAADTLVKIGRYVVEPLAAALGDRDADVRLLAADALAQLRDARAVEPLVAALRDRDGDVRHAAVEALRRIGTPEALAALQEHKAEQAEQR